MKSIRLLSIAFCGSAAALQCAAPAQAEELCFTASVVNQPTNWSDVVAIRRFDRALGTLQSITVGIRGTVDGVARVENLDAATAVVTQSFRGEVRTMRPDLSSICVVAPSADFEDTLSSFDGLRDYRGTSGVTHTEIHAVLQDAVTLLVPASDLELFSGPFGAPGDILLPVLARGISVTSGSGNLLSQFTQTAAVEVNVCYQFIPFVPPLIQCPGTQIGSVGVEMSFDLEAWMASTKEPASLTASGMPVGAKLEPVSAGTGNMLRRRFTWTPTAEQVGSTAVTFTATDSLTHATSCTVTLIAAECHMLFASATGSSAAIVFGHIYDTQLAGVRRFYPVTMGTHPSVRASALPPVFVVQVVMYNPFVFAAEPSRSSQPMTVTRDATGHMQSSYSGTDGGICIRLHEFFLDGVRYVRFPFEVLGM
jgi:hypothetical protein